MKPVFSFGFVLLLSVASLSQAYYYNEEGEVEDDGFAESSGRARSLYTRSIKSAPLSPSRKSYTPPSPSRARLSAPAPAVKGYEPQQRFEQQTYDTQSAVPKINHEVDGRPEPYNFNYDVKDDYGNSQYRREDSDDTGAVRGSYGYTDANGLYRIVDYVADDNGFRATIRTNEPGLVEPSPATGEVQNPADVILNAEATPAGVREQQQRYSQQSKLRGGSSGGSSYGGGSSSSSSYGGSSSQSLYGGGSGSGSQSSYGGGQSSFGGGSNYISQQKLPSRSGTKY